MFLHVVIIISKVQISDSHAVKVPSPPLSPFCQKLNIWWILLRQTSLSAALIHSIHIILMHLLLTYM